MTGDGYIKMERRNRVFNRSRNGILLTEFRFYNKQKEVIKQNILKEINTRLENEDSIFWTNSVYAKKGYGFHFFKENYKRNKKLVTEKKIDLIHYTTELDVEKYNLTKKCFNKSLFVLYDISEEEKNFLDCFYDNITDSITDNIYVYSWNDIVDYFITSKLLDKYLENSEIDDYKNDIMLLFNKEIEPTSYYINRRGWTSFVVRHIIDVFEKRINNINYRIIIQCNCSMYQHYKFKVVDEYDKYYNQFDKGRLYIKKNNRFYFFTEEQNVYTKEKELIVNLDLIKLIFDNIEEVLGEEYVINNNIYSFFNNRVQTYEFDRGKLSVEEEKIINQYLKLINDGKKVIINQVIIDKNNINVDNGYFNLNFNDNFINIKDIFVQLHTLLNDNNIRYNFNVLWEHILKLSKIKYINVDYSREIVLKNWQELNFKINDIDVCVKRDNNRMKINDIFCRINDVMYILSKLPCFTTKEEFNKYVKDVSYIGVDWKQMISNGILIKLTNPFGSLYNNIGLNNVKEMNLRFSLLWDMEKRNNVYLLLNDKKYLIKYKGKFKSALNIPQISTNISELKNILDESIEGLDDDIIIDIIENALIEAKIIKERGEELVKNTIVETEAKENTIHINGKKTIGYIVIGNKSKTKYFIKKDDLTVYRYKNGNWDRRCVVDDYNKQRIFEDRLANRLVNIYNEPKKIYTLFN